MKSFRNDKSESVTESAIIVALVAAASLFAFACGWVCSSLR